MNPIPGVAYVTARFIVRVPVSDAEAASVASGDAPEVEDEVFRRARTMIAASAGPSAYVEEDVAAIESSTREQL